MSRRTEMEAKLRKGPEMLGRNKFHERMKKHILDFASEIDELTAERDRLAAENAELRELLEIEQATAHDAAELSAAWANAASEANATLDELREVVRTGFNNQEVAQRVLEILYPQPKETTDDER